VWLKTGWEVGGGGGYRGGGLEMSKEGGGAGGAGAGGGWDIKVGAWRDILAPTGGRESIGSDIDGLEGK